VRDRPFEFVLCADDFALSNAVSRGILALVDAGRLTAVSVMATTPLWPETAPELAARRDRVAIGLHLDLTHRPFGGRRPAYDLHQLIVKALCRRADVSAISAEFERQFDLFEDAYGHPPDHVDGHHHVHALPQVRAAFFNVLAKRFSGLPAERRPLARDPTDSVVRILRRRGARAKALTVAGLGYGFAARAAASGIGANVGFAGFSRFAGDGRYEREFDEFLAAPGPRHLVMCHPGLDEGAGSHGEEYRCLMASDVLPRAMLRIRRGGDERRGAFADWLSP